MDSQWQGKCPSLIAFCVVHLTHMETGERALKASQAATFNGWGGQLWKGSRAKRQNRWGEDSAFWGWKHRVQRSDRAKAPCSPSKIATEMSPVSKWALSLNCANAYQPSWPSPRPPTPLLVPELWQKGTMPHQPLVTAVTSPSPDTKTPAWPQMPTSACAHWVSLKWSFIQIKKTVFILLSHVRLEIVP